MDVVRGREMEGDLGLGEGGGRPLGTWAEQEAGVEDVVSPIFVEGEGEGAMDETEEDGGVKIRREILGYLVVVQNLHEIEDCDGRGGRKTHTRDAQLPDHVDTAGGEELRQRRYCY